MDGLAVARGALTFCGEKLLVEAGNVDSTGGDDSVFDECDGYAEGWEESAYEILGTVDGVDDPGALLSDFVGEGVATEFLADDDIVRVDRVDALGDESLDVLVCVGEHIDGVEF